MLISMDHDCTPDCPICIPEEDLLKFVKKRKIVAQSIPRALWLLYILYVFVAVAAVGDPFWIASAIFGQDLQSHASGGLTGGQSSIGLAEKLELIEFLSKDIRLSLPESAQIMTAKEAGTSAIKYPNPGPSPSRGNLDSSASSSEKKSDAPATPHPTGDDHLFQLTMTALLYAILAIGGYLSGTDSDNSGRDSCSELLGARTDSDYSARYSGQDSGCPLLGAGTHSDYSGQDQDLGWEQLRAGTDSDYSGGDSGLDTDSDYSGRDSGWGTDSGWETDSDYSGRDSGWGLLRSVTNEECNDALTEGTSNFDEETVTEHIQEPVITRDFVALPKNESSCSLERMISSSIEAAGFPREVELDITISAQRLAGSTTGGFLKSNEGLSDNDTTERLQSEDDEKSVQSEEMEKSGQSEEVDHESGSDEERRVATMVQARSRGHLVRTSRPLVQLREISGIEEKLKKLKELAGDGAFLDLLRRKESMAKLAVEEETMKLLLRLDSIQGSHPLVRQIRKSVAREIVSLQESFNALLSKSINTRR